MRRRGRAVGGEPAWRVAGLFPGAKGTGPALQRWRTGLSHSVPQGGGPVQTFLISAFLPESRPIWNGCLLPFYPFSVPFQVSALLRLSRLRILLSRRRSLPGRAAKVVSSAVLLQMLFGGLLMGRYTDDGVFISHCSEFPTCCPPAEALRSCFHWSLGAWLNYESESCTLEGHIHNISLFPWIGFPGTEWWADVLWNNLVGLDRGQWTIFYDSRHMATLTVQSNFQADNQTIFRKSEVKQDRYCVVKLC